MSVVPPRGLYVEVDHPSGTTRTPTILDASEVRPRLNGRPEVRIAVPQEDYWFDTEWERQPMRVWRNGDRLPIEEIANVTESESRIELIGRGGSELRQRYEADVGDKSAHDTLRDVLASISYPSTVDPAPTMANELYRTLSNTSEFESIATDVDDPTAPIDYLGDGDAPEPKQTCYLLAPQDFSTVDLVSDSSVNWSASEALELAIGESSTANIEIGYEIPAENVGIAVRIAEGTPPENTGSALLKLSIDGEVEFNSSAGDGSKTVEWDNGALGLPTLSGEHTISLSVSDGGYSEAEGPVWIDCVAIFDTRYWDATAFSNQLDANNLLEGPPGLYAPVDIDFRARPIRRSTGGRLEATVSSTANSQALGLSQSGEDGSFTTMSNYTILETDFGSDADAFTARVTLGGVDATSVDTTVETSLTRYRTEPQSLSELVIKYDVLDSPTIAETLDDRVEDLLSGLSDRANLIWELQWDDSNGSPAVVVTRPGQRSSNADPSLAGYEIEKDLDREISGATIYGRSQRVEAERFDADPSGTDLRNDRIQENSERVQDPTDGTVYERGEDADYTVNYYLGILSAGDAQSDIDQGQQLSVGYEWLPEGEVARPNINYENHFVETINALTTDAACRQAAQYLVDELDGPQWGATITIPRQEAGFALVEAIAPSQLPEPPADGYRIRGITESAETIRLELGARPSASEVVAEIESTIASASREV